MEIQEVEEACPVAVVIQVVNLMVGSPDLGSYLHLALENHRMDCLAAAAAGFQIEAGRQVKIVVACQMKIVMVVEVTVAASSALEQNPGPGNWKVASAASAVSASWAWLAEPAASWAA